MPVDRKTTLKRRRLLVAAAAFAVLAACEPTVKIQVPTEPITINLNIKLDADVRIKLEEQAVQDIDKNKDIF